MQEAHVHEPFATVDPHLNLMFVLMHEQALIHLSIRRRSYLVKRGSNSE